MKDLMDLIKLNCQKCGNLILDDSMERYKQRGNYCFRCNSEAKQIRYEPLYQESAEKARKALPISREIAEKYNITEI